MIGWLIYAAAIFGSSYAVGYWIGRTAWTSRQPRYPARPTDRSIRCADTPKLPKAWARRNRIARGTETR